MDPRLHKAFRSLSEAITIILEAANTQASVLGNTHITPLHVIDRILDFHFPILCGACLYTDQPHPQRPLQCRALKFCIRLAINRIPVICPAEPRLNNVLVVAIKAAIEREKSRQRRDEQQVPPMLDVEQLLVSMLDDLIVRTVIEEAGFSTTVIKNNVENGGTVFNCES